jgi:hypothetical protein
MDDRVSNFWKLRSSGLLTEARLLFSQLEKASLPESVLALMNISLLRADQGPLVAEAELQKLEDQGLFGAAPDFQLYYQKACNSYAQGHYSQALEQLLKLGQPKDPWNRMMAMTTKLICLDCLGFEFDELANEIESEIKNCKEDALKVVAMPSYMGVRVRQFFRQGNWDSLFQLQVGSAWSQLTYFQSWVANIPYLDFSGLNTDSSTLIRNSLQKLTSEPDFYLRNYRLQTLVGRAYVAPKNTPTTWGDRADRLYLWTWRWLLAPTPSHAEALSMILMEFDGWNGQDVLTGLDAELVFSALEWIRLFEPRVKVRSAALYRRVQAPVAKRSPLFELEALWIEKAKAHLQMDQKSVIQLQSKILSHPLSKSKNLNFFKVWPEIENLIIQDNKNFQVDTDSGHLKSPHGNSLTSLPLARLMELLVRQQRVSFEDVLTVCFEINGFDPIVHDAKIQNLVMRAKTFLKSPRSLKTKDRWVFFEKPDSLKLSFQTRRYRLVLSSPAVARLQSERLKNERSLHVLLKKVPQLHGAWLTREDLGKALNIPKSTLNRYLQTWLRRNWLVRQGQGRAIRYQVSFWKD